MTISGSGPCRKVGQDAEAGLLRHFEHAGLLAADIFELAHAEEGEVVVAQPFEEGDTLLDLGAVERQRGVAELVDRLVEAGEHRLPVADGGAHLRQDIAEPLLQRLRGLGTEPRDVDVDHADALDRGVGLAGGGLAGEARRAALAARDEDHRMQHQHRLAGAVGDLAEDRVEQERHVVVDDGDGGDLPSLALQRRVVVDGDDALAAPVPGERVAGQLGRALEHVVVVGSKVFRRGAKSQKFRKRPCLRVVFVGFRRFPARCHGDFPSRVFCLLLS